MVEGEHVVCVASFLSLWWSRTTFLYHVPAHPVAPCLPASPHPLAHVPAFAVLPQVRHRSHPFPNLSRRNPRHRSHTFPNLCRISTQPPRQQLAPSLAPFPETAIRGRKPRVNRLKNSHLRVFFFIKGTDTQIWRLFVKCCRIVTYVTL